MSNRVVDSPTQERESSMTVQTINHDGQAQAPVPLPTLPSSVGEVYTNDLQAFAL